MTVIASWGGSTSDSYLSWTAANSFIRSAVVNIDAWTKADQRKQEAALKQATIDVDTRQYIGERYYTAQKLEFPRRLIVSWPLGVNVSTEITGQTDAEERMQSDVERATCFQAMWILRNGGRNPHAERIASGVTLAENEAGPLRERYEYKGKAMVLCSEALALLAPWMTSKIVLRG